MKIDRSNYEIWFIDWLDGNLNDLQIEEVLLFLYQNPDLQKDFEDISTFSLKSSEKEFPGKSNLKKSTADLTESQFEYLSVAYLENDLSVNQEAELKEIIEHDAEKNKTFNFIQKLKLTPQNVRYINKNQLIKKPIIQRVIRLSVIGLSAAATLAFIVTIYQLIPQTLPVKNKEGLTSVTTQSKEESVSVAAQRKDGPVSVAVLHKDGLQSILDSTSEKLAEVPETVAKRSIPIDSILRDGSNEEVYLNKIPVSARIDINGMNINNSLIASNRMLIIPSYDEQRSNVGRFIAKNFREIFLKEKAPKDTPLKGYEIAEVGVKGLNKLLGWEMALDKMNDENGELRSVQFNSKTVNFTVPVKKTELSE